MFVGTVVRKATWAQSVLVESKESVWLPWKPKQKNGTDEGNRLVGAWRTSCSGGTAAAASSCELSGLGIV